MTRKSGKPERLDALIDAAIARLGLTRAFQQQQALMIWSEIVGKSIAGATEPERIEHGRLYIRVKNSVWRQEIHFYKKAIIEKMNGQLGNKVVKDIILV